MSAELGRPGLRPNLTTERRRVLSRRVQLFVVITITYNVIEAVIALTEGTRVSSTALIGFGLDSVIEVSSAAAVAWQFASPWLPPVWSSCPSCRGRNAAPGVNSAR
jgi:hypothetical protein